MLSRTVSSVAILTGVVFAVFVSFDGLATVVIGRLFGVVNFRFTAVPLGDLRRLAGGGVDEDFRFLVDPAWVFCFFGERSGDFDGFVCLIFAGLFLLVFVGLLLTPFF